MRWDQNEKFIKKRTVEWMLWDSLKAMTKIHGIQLLHIVCVWCCHKYLNEAKLHYIMATKQGNAHTHTNPKGGDTSTSEYNKETLNQIPASTQFDKENRNISKHFCDHRKQNKREKKGSRQQQQQKTQRIQWEWHCVLFMSLFAKRMKILLENMRCWTSAVYIFVHFSCQQTEMDNFNFGITLNQYSFFRANYLRGKPVAINASPFELP